MCFMLSSHPFFHYHRVPVDKTRWTGFVKSRRQFLGLFLRSPVRATQFSFVKFSFHDSRFCETTSKLLSTTLLFVAPLQILNGACTTYSPFFRTTTTFWHDVNFFGTISTFWHEFNVFDTTSTFGRAFSFWHDFK